MKSQMPVIKEESELQVYSLNDKRFKDSDYEEGKVD